MSSRCFASLAALVLALFRGRAAAAEERGSVEREGLGDDGTLVVSVVPSAATTTVCVAPIAEDALTPSEERLLMERGGLGSVEHAAALDVWCASLPSEETPFALWLAGRVLERVHLPSAPTLPDGSPLSASVAPINRYTRDRKDE